MSTVNPELQAYVEAEILPRYDAFDKAHQLGVDVNMAYAIAAYHDTGLTEGRELHHKVSAQIIRNDKRLRQWFTEEQIEVMANASEDHRASNEQPPRTIYGRIVAEADRFIDPEDIIRRTVQFGHDHYPTLSREEHYERMVQHLHEKYGRNGYLRLWFPDSPNAQRLEELRCIIDDEEQLRKWFDICY